MNYEYIVNVLCENRDNPKLHCDGKCYLMKKLAKESEGAHENPFENKQSKTELQLVWFIQSVPRFFFWNGIEDTVLNNFKKTPIFLANPFTATISQPPERG